MELQEALAARRSVREYADTPVAREVVEQLLAAAVLAPSAMNTQNWAFGVVQGAEKVQALGERARVALLAAMDHQGVTGGFRDWIASPDCALFYGAPTLVVIYATTQDPSGVVNCSLAAGNLMLAATDLGLGTCWIGLADELLNSADTKREFGVPEEYRSVAPVIVGYPACETPAKERSAPVVLYWD
jgi:nitroreductase